LRVEGESDGGGEERVSEVRGTEGKRGVGSGERVL
jgi:hypothetical protein